MAATPTSGRVTRIDDATFLVGDTTFVADWHKGVSQPDRFAIMKSEALIEDYISVLEAMPDANIIELGVREGGSTALLALLGRPRKLVAFELEHGAPALTAFIERNGLTETVRPWFGVDQADRGRIAEIVAKEFDGQAIDLVIDDASHYLEPTRRSFEAIFPHVRPGGLYLIEDWAWQHELAVAFGDALNDPTAANHDQVRDHFTARITDPDTPEARAFEARLATELADSSSEASAEFERRMAKALRDPDSPEGRQLEARMSQARDDPSSPAARVLTQRMTGETPTPPPARESDEAIEKRPLVALIMQLLMARACSGDAVSELTIGPYWVSVRRGRAPLDASSFRVTDLYTDHFGLLTNT